MLIYWADVEKMPIQMQLWTFFKKKLKLNWINRNVYFCYLKTSIILFVFHLELEHELNAQKKLIEIVAFATFWSFLNYQNPHSCLNASNENWSISKQMKHFDIICII